MSPPRPAPTIYVVDDDDAVRESLSSLLRAEGMTVRDYASPQSFLQAPTLDTFACILLDVRMPGIDGLALQEQLTRQGVTLPIIFLSGHGDVPDAVRAMKAGAIDFLKKPFEDYHLLGAIAQALARVRRHAQEKQELADLQRRYAQLTPRECEILTLVTQGKANKVIALELGVAESTVKVHRHNVMAKMQLRSLPGLTLALQRLQGAGSGAEPGEGGQHLA